MKECMNCGGPVADDEPNCATCGLARGLVLFGERPWSDDDAGGDTETCCSQCGEPIEDDDLDDFDVENDEISDLCADCRLELEQAGGD